MKKAPENPAEKALQELAEELIVRSTEALGPNDVCLCAGAMSGHLAARFAQRQLAVQAIEIAASLATMPEVNGAFTDAVQGAIEYGAVCECLAKRANAIIPAPMLHRVLCAMGFSDETVSGQVVTGGASASWTEPCIVLETGLFYVNVNCSAFDMLIASVPQDETWFLHIGTWTSVLPEETVRAVEETGYPLDVAMHVPSYAAAASSMTTQPQRDALFRVLGGLRRSLVANATPNKGGSSVTL